MLKLFRAFLRRKMIASVDRRRSAEQWAGLSEMYKGASWQRKSNAKICSTLGFRYCYRETGSVLDGWSEWFFASCYPALPSELGYEDVVFKDHSHRDLPIPRDLGGHRGWNTAWLRQTRKSESWCKPRLLELDGMQIHILQHKPKEYAPTVIKCFPDLAHAWRAYGLWELVQKLVVSYCIPVLTIRRNLCVRNLVTLPGNRSGTFLWNWPGALYFEIISLAGNLIYSKLRTSCRTSSGTTPLSKPCLLGTLLFKTIFGALFGTLQGTCGFQASGVVKLCTCFTSCHDLSSVPARQGSFRCGQTLWGKARHNPYSIFRGHVLQLAQVSPITSCAAAAAKGPTVRAVPNAMLYKLQVTKRISTRVCVLLGWQVKSHPVCSWTTRVASF